MTHLLLIIIYIAFIGLGLPDGLLGAGWPSMYQELAAPVSFAGIISMIITLGTVISSLASDTLTFKLGAGKITALSTGLTGLAILGFANSSSLWMLCLWAVPYGLGAGSIDAAINNYVALHYSSRHMSWLHCMWGLGALIGPYIMGYILSGGNHWSYGYLYVGIIQFVLTAVLFLSLPLWKERPSAVRTSAESNAVSEKPIPLKEVLHIPGAKEVMIAFFCYCAMEQTAMLWAGSYFVLNEGFSEEIAAAYASTFFLGITIGRGICGFIPDKYDDTLRIRIGAFLVVLGSVIMLLPLSSSAAVIGYIFIGLGCAPIYPCIIHSTPFLFGSDKSQALIGIQMASAYIGSTVMPPVFGWIAEYFSISLLPVVELIIILLMLFMYEKLLNKIQFITHLY